MLYGWGSLGLVVPSCLDRCYGSQGLVVLHPSPSIQLNSAYVSFMACVTMGRGSHSPSREIMGSCAISAHNPLSCVVISYKESTNRRTCKGQNHGKRKETMGSTLSPTCVSQTINPQFQQNPFNILQSGLLLVNLGNSSWHFVEQVCREILDVSFEILSGCPISKKNYQEGCWGELG